MSSVSNNSPIFIDHIDINELTLEQRIRSTSNLLSALKRQRNNLKKQELLQQQQDTQDAYAYAERILHPDLPEIIKVTKIYKYGNTQEITLNKPLWDHIIHKANQPIDNFLYEDIDLQSLYSFKSINK